MSSNKTDGRTRAESARIVEKSLPADRAGRDRAIDRADEQPPDNSHLADTPNTPGSRPL